MTAPIPHELVEEIRNSIDIVDIVGEYVVLQKRGRNHTGLCPFHNEKTPSFSVSPEKQMFYCFGCGAGGDVYKFLMQARHMTFPEAITVLAERSGITVPVQIEQGKDNSRLQELQRLLEMHQLAMRFYHTTLIRHPAARSAREYLQARAITERVIEDFQLGFAPNSWDALRSHLQSHGYRPAEMIQAGLALPREKQEGCYDRFRHRVMFPVIDWRQRVIGFGGRVIDEGQPKYLNSPETPAFQKGKVLYGLHLATAAIREEGYSIVVEGYMDAIAAHQAGIRHTVATLGTAFTNEQARLLLRHTRDVVIAYDADTAGQQATLRGLDILRQIGCRVKVAVLPPGQDPDDFLRREGPEAFRELVQTKALTLIAYKLERAVAGRNLGTIEGRVDALNDVLPDLHRLTNAVERDEYVRLISNRLKLKEEVIYVELRRQTGEKQRSGTWRDNSGEYRNNKDGIPLTLRFGRNDPEIQLLRCMLEDPGIILKAKRQLGGEIFTDNAAREIAVALEQRVPEEGLPTPVQLMADLPDDLAKQLLAQLVMIEHPLPGGKGLEDLINRVEINRLEIQVQNKLAEMDRAEAVGDVDLSRRLQGEIQALQKTISVLKTGKR